MQSDHLRENDGIAVGGGIVQDTRNVVSSHGHTCGTVGLDKLNKWRLTTKQTLVKIEKRPGFTTDDDSIAALQEHTNRCHRRLCLRRLWGTRKHEFNCGHVTVTVGSDAKR